MYYILFKIFCPRCTWNHILYGLYIWSFDSVTTWKWSKSEKSLSNHQDYISQFQILEAKSYNRDHRVQIDLVEIIISKSRIQNSWFHCQIFFKEKKIRKIPLILNDRKSEWFQLELAQKILNGIQCMYKHPDNNINDRATSLSILLPESIYLSWLDLLPLCFSQV